MLRYTTDHASSSYGQPVLVDDETGVAYGSGDILTTAQVAALLDIDQSHVRRLAVKHGIGTKLSDRVAILTVADAEQMRGLLKPGHGRPRRDP